MTDKTPRPSKRPKSNSKAPARRVTPQPGRIEPMRSLEVKAAAPRQHPAASSPDIQVALAPAGRETLDAIAGELAPKRAPRSRARSAADSTPDIEIEQRPVGRETLAAINEELAASARDSLPTLPYGDRVPNAPGAVTPSRPPGPAPVPRSVDAPPLSLAEAEIFEMRTFVLRRADAESLNSEEARQKFVSERLAHRLPGGAAGVSRVDITPWTEQETLILRVWSRVDGIS
ncbi:MAG: hypothetical protein QM756_26800 [Polyangiaceae bacterium]